MSIKDLFGSTHKQRNLLSSTTEKDAFSEAESARNVKQAALREETYLPHLDYTNPATFAKFGSAYLYYKSAMERILDFYPYDGSDAELNKFYNDSLNIEKYIFNNLYPRTNGYINLSATGYGSVSSVLEGNSQTGIASYGAPASLEYITFKGGPNIISTSTTLKSMYADPSSSQYQSNNVYDTNIYTSAGLISNYGSGSRESNLKSNFDTGVTVEFWSKTGSVGSDPTQTTKQVLFDMWNNELSSSDAYARFTIELTGGAGAIGPLLITVQSGNVSASANRVVTSSIGQNLDFNDWKHYALVFQSGSGYDFKAKLYVDGELNDTNTYTGTGFINELNSKNMMGRIGGLLTAPSGACDLSLTSSYAGAGKLSGSLDEFRFWKTARNGAEIGKYWFDQIRGGVNSDIANAALGMYYKFNEGIVGSAGIDGVVLDYGGRLCNGTWTGYAAGSGSEASRNTGSAIVSASAASKEYLDPIIYATHPEVSSLKTSLLNSGSWYDGMNNGMFRNMLPGWVIELGDSSEDNELERMCHIVGAYFDTLHSQITAIPKFKHHHYPSGSEQPIPFAQHLPQSLGLYTPEIFIDSTILEKFKNRSNSELFEKNLTEAKNLIYTNLYNNLSNIFKSKGTERAVRNTLRCFNLDDNLVTYNVYAHNQLFELKDNLKQTLKKKTFANFNDPNNTRAVIYQSVNPHSASTRGYISGSQGDGHEYKDGFTVEAGVTFPRFFRHTDPLTRDFITSSLFGLQTVNTASLTDPAFLTGSQDVANFQVYAIRDEKYSRNVRFMLTSAVDPCPFPTLTSSNTFLNVYDTENWNFSVRIRPSNYPLTDIVSSSAAYTYDVIFAGYNNQLGVIQNYFEATGSMSKADGQSMLSSAKRMYAGARNTNITGAHVYKSDVLISNAKYWTKYIDAYTLKEHTWDRDNAGISGSYLSLSPLTSFDSYNYNTLALDWYFGNVTASNASGDFYVKDISSGSALIQDNFGWVGQIAGHLHSGRGYGFGTSSANVVRKDVINDFKFIEPERAVGSDQVQILSEDDRLFGTVEQIPNYVYTIEKSLYAAVSEEILDFFAGAADFHHLIGQPVNRYRGRYKEMENLRRIFFEKFQNIQTVEKFTEYYKWFDDALAIIIKQLVPGSANFVEDVYNTVESHVLERNKYKSQYPTIEFMPPDPEGILASPTADEEYEIDATGGPTSSPRNVNKHINYWKKKADPRGAGTGSYEIATGIPAVDINRLELRRAKWRKRITSGSKGRLLTKADGTKYMANMSVLNQRKGTYIFHTPTIQRTIKGGVNFESAKDIGYTYASLYAAGPINHDDGIFVPQNVMVGFTDEMEPLQALDLRKELVGPNHLTKRYMSVYLGRDFTDGIGYDVIKNSTVFPFNILSSSVSGGYNQRVLNRVTSGIEVTNLHNDVYGPDMEVPLQGPFTDAVVGGHQSRHVPLNTGTDNYLTRPEAWKLLLGKCAGQAEATGAIGMVSPDYPYPEANAEDMNPYPMTGAQKATYYRGMTAKRPVNITNLPITTASSGLGNYTHNYEVVQTVGAYSNPKKFVENNSELQLPTQAFQNNSTSSTQVRTILDIHRSDGWLDAHNSDAPPYGGYTGSHFKFVDEYSINYLTGGVKYSSVIVSKFSNPGGLEVSPPGYRDFRADEYSVYSATPYRNLTVIKPSQGPSGSISEPTGAGGPGIRVFDIHGYDYGLRSQLSRHTAQFGRDSLWVTGTTSVFQADDPRSGAPGSHYNQLPGFHKINRNPLKRPRLCGATSTAATGSITMTGVPSDGDTLTIHYDGSVSRVYTWRNTPSLSGDVEIAPSANESAKKLNTAINSSYSTALFTSTWDGASLVSVTNNKPGPSANIAITASPLNAWATLAGMAGGSELNEPTYCDSVEYDNFFVQHQIPRSDRQYAWITGAISQSSDYRYYGFMPTFGPMMGMYSSSVGGIEAFFPFVSASDMGSAIVGGARTFGYIQREGKAGYLPNAFNYLNIDVYEPLSASTNTLGRSDVPLVAVAASDPQFANTTLVPFVRGGVQYASARLFNPLMFKRNNVYGWGTFNQSRQHDHPILRTERKNNKLSLVKSGSSIEKFDLRPLSLKGRPVLINYDYDTHKTVRGITSTTTQNTTFKTTYNNEMIYFNQESLNDYLDIEPDTSAEVTSFEQLVALRMSPDFNLNWIHYSECVYPSMRNEFASASSFRSDYDNKYWRKTQAERLTVGTALSNSLGVYWGTAPTYDGRLSQSSWPLDAPSDFLTRDGPPVLGYFAPAHFALIQKGDLRLSNSAGELQNTYGWWHASGAVDLVGGNKDVLRAAFFEALSPGALYARKHTLNSPLSITTPGHLTPTWAIGSYSASFEFFPVQYGATLASTGSGEAWWDAPTTAGYLTKSISTEGQTSGSLVTGFVSASSEPWFNNYSDFKADLKLKARGYSVIPEFRISEHIEDYINGGTSEAFDTFDIPGTPRNSTQDNFYIEYSNSDFMKYFLDIRNMSDLSATEFKLTCRAAIRFNPYKGFYPAQRTLDLVSQFSKSYGKSIIADPNLDYATTELSGAQSSLARMIYQPLFAPGILYNSIKSGIACDWPIVAAAKTPFLNAYNFTGSDIQQDGQNFAWYPQYYAYNYDVPTQSPFKSGSAWTTRLPFEAILEPDTYMNGMTFIDMEPHPSASFAWSVSASLDSATNDSVYSLMASNFAAEVGNFFLKGANYTKLSSRATSLDKVKFAGDGEVYGARLRIKNSFEGERSYQYESSSTGDNSWFTTYGAQAVNSGSSHPDGTALPTGSLTMATGAFEIPQDPQYNPYFKRDFIMYSRTTAFGPPFSGRIPGDIYTVYNNKWPLPDQYVSASVSGTMDCFNGYNWAYTPPHQHGEAWVDFVFRPSGNVDYDLDRILAETQIVKWRHDPGPRIATEIPSASIFRRSLVADSPPGSDIPNYGLYNSYNTNHNAMQLDNSVNLLGVEEVFKETTDKFGNTISTVNEIAGKKWVIQPKFETPMLNFADVGVHAITGSGNTKSLPSFGADTAPNGMWHQFGTMPDTPNKGVFLEIGDIPPEWLKYHYSVVSESSAYNNNSPSNSIYGEMKSFAALMGFEPDNSRVRLGEIAPKQTIKEAIVAVPYIIENAQVDPKNTSSDDAVRSKRFINIPKARYDAALIEFEGSAAGDSLDAAGVSIRELVRKMKEYVLPQQLDFIQNPLVDPIVMYLFEFKYDLDQDDLSYIWQNLAPRNYKKMSFQTEAVAHELFNTELLTEQNLMENPNLRWMVFKVKQKSQAQYQDLTVRQASSAGSKLMQKPTAGYPLKFNWPYDYVSIVELAKIEAEVLYKQPPTTLMAGSAIDGQGPMNRLSKLNASLNRGRRSSVASTVADIASETAKVQAKKVEAVVNEKIADAQATAMVEKAAATETRKTNRTARQTAKRTAQLKNLKTTIDRVNSKTLDPESTQLKKEVKAKSTDTTTKSTTPTTIKKY